MPQKHPPANTTACWPGADASAASFVGGGTGTDFPPPAMTSAGETANQASIPKTTIPVNPVRKDVFSMTPPLFRNGPKASYGLEFPDTRKFRADQAPRKGFLLYCCQGFSLSGRDFKYGSAPISVVLG